MSDKPLIIDEPVATGWLRSEYHGDQDKAKGYALQARKVLGGMRSMYGVNDRIANGEGGGFYKQAVHLPDGTRIEALTNDGHDTLRIYASSSSESSGAASKPEFPSTAFEGTPTSYSFTPEFSIEIPEQKIEIPEILPQPYMWIGARIRWEDYPDVSNPYYGLTVMVIEPGDNGLVISDSNIRWSETVWGDATTEKVDLVAAQASFSDRFPSSPPGMHNFRFQDNTSTAYGSQFLFTKNGLRLYDVMTCYDTDDTFQPYDPDLDDDKQAGDRFFPIAGSYFYDRTQQIAWDQVVVLDPYEEEAIAPSDERDATNWSRRLLERSGMASGIDCVLPGEYIVKIAAQDDPRPVSVRAGQQSPNLPPGFTYSDTTDFREYLKARNLPLRVEVEVRLYKEPFTSVDTFTIEVPDYDDMFRTTYPFGDSIGYSCSYYSGGNPHAANWWQGAIRINPTDGTAKQESYYAPAGVFTPSSYDFDKLYRTRYPADIYCFTGGSISTLANSMAVFLDRMCTGYYGYSTEIVLRTEAELSVLTAGLTHNRIYLYDIIANTFADVGYYEFIFPFDPYWLPLRLASRAKCRRPFWVDSLGNAGSGIAQQVGDPDLGNTCCEDVFFGGT